MAEPTFESIAFAYPRPPSDEDRDLIPPIFELSTFDKDVDVFGYLTQPYPIVPLLPVLEEIAKASPPVTSSRGMPEPPVASQSVLGTRKREEEYEPAERPAKLRAVCEEEDEDDFSVPAFMPHAYRAFAQILMDYLRTTLACTWQADELKPATALCAPRTGSKPFCGTSGADKDVYEWATSTILPHGIPAGDYTDAQITALCAMNLCDYVSIKDRATNKPGRIEPAVRIGGQVVLASSIASRTTRIQSMSQTHEGGPLKTNRNPNATHATFAYRGKRRYNKFARKYWHDSKNIPKPVIAFWLEQGIAHSPIHRPVHPDAVSGQGALVPVARVYPLEPSQWKTLTFPEGFTESVHPVFEHAKPNNPIPEFAWVAWRIAYGTQHVDN